MMYMKVRLGNYIEEYSKKNKADEDIPVYSVTSTQGFCRDYFGKEGASKDKTTYKIVPQGCFAYNPSRINVGSVDWQRNEERVIVSPLYNVFSVSEELDQEYLYYYLKSDFALQRIREVETGSVRDNLKLEMLKEFPILLPPKNDQKTIANNLDRVKRIIELRKSEIDKMNELIKARFVEMFGDVMHNDRKWECKQFSDITTSRLGKMLDAKHQTGTCKYPYLANFNVQWFRFELDNLNEMDFNEKDREEFCLEDGDLLVCEGGEIGRCAVWHNQVKKCFFQKALHRVRCNQDIILPDYLAWWFKYNCENGGFAAIEGAKATISHLTGVKMKMLDVTVPAIELQEQFADFIKQVDKSKVAVQKALEKTQLLFDSLMQQYFG